MPSDEPSPPPLEQGDHLTRPEFERRYAATPRLKKAELIEGIVYIPAPVRWKQHAAPHADLLAWLGFYKAYTPFIVAGSNSTLRLDWDNELQPDGIMILDRSQGGQTRISTDDYVEGSPELVAEVASSSVSIELHTKLRVCRRNGVREYIVWRVLDKVIDWFVLRDTDYTRMSPGQDGLYRSTVFPGLWLEPTAMTSGDMMMVLQVLQWGLDTPEHTAFVAKLQQHEAIRP